MGVRLYVDEERSARDRRDYGVGMPAAVCPGERSDGIGVSVIRALADESCSPPSPDGGTEVQIDFAARDDGWTLPDGAGRADPDERLEP